MKRNFRPKLKKQVDNTKKDTIVLKHEEDKPFGPLRNDYKSDLYIDGKRWNSVVIMSSLIYTINDFRKQTIEHLNPHQVEKNYYDVKLKLTKVHYHPLLNWNRI